MPLSWVEHPDVVCGLGPGFVAPRWDVDAPSPPARAFLFDLHHTLITPRGARVHAKDRADWKWWHDSVPTRLAELAADPRNVVVVVGECAHTPATAPRELVQGQVDDALGGLPVCVLVAPGDTPCRKPRPGAWHFFSTFVAPHALPHLCVGDAAGRLEGWQPGRRADASDADRKFAANIGCPFKTPEEFFLGAPPAALPRLPNWASLLGGPAPEWGPRPDREVVVLVGRPASGKSTAAATLFQPAGYRVVSRDGAGTAARAAKAVQAALAEGASVVVDHTHATVAERAPHIAAAAAAGCPVRALVLAPSPALADHLAAFRAAQGGKRVPRATHTAFTNKYVAPTTGEGFSAVQAVQPPLAVPDDLHAAFCTHYCA